MLYNRDNEIINLHHEVLNEAKKCRNFFQQKRNILEKFPRYINDELACLCGIASFFLCYRLRKMKYKADLIIGKYDGDCHCWVTLNDYILDITATQFKDLKGFPVYVTKTTNKKYYQEETNLNCLKRFKKWGDQAIFLKIHNGTGKYLTYLIEEYNKFIFSSS